MKKILAICFAFIMVAGLSVALVPSSQVSAKELTEAQKALRDAAVCQEKPNASTCPQNCPDPAAGVALTPEQSSAGCEAARDCSQLASDCNVVAKYLNPLITVISILAGLAIVTGIIVGGIQYASSGGDPQKAATGKKHIKMAIIGLIGFLFMYAFLALLIPGGSTLLLL